MRQKLDDYNMVLEEKNKISEISKFSILSYAQNWKLGNLKSFLLLQLFIVVVGQEFKTVASFLLL